MHISYTSIDFSAWSTWPSAQSTFVHNKPPEDVAKKKKNAGSKRAVIEIDGNANNQAMNVYTDNAYTDNAYTDDAKGTVAHCSKRAKHTNE